MRSDFYGIVLSLFSIIIAVFFMRISYGNKVAVFVTIAGVIISVIVSIIARRSVYTPEEDDYTEKKLRLDNKKNVGPNITQINANQNYDLIKSREKKEKALCLTSIPAAFDLIGREKEIQEIRKMLVDSPVVFISGEAGVGKTAIAVSLINEEKKKILLRESNYQYIAWITNWDNIKEGFLMLNIPDINRSNRTDETIQQIANWLQIHPSFIVIDQIDLPLEREDMIFLNTLSGETKILITTRVHNPVFSTFHLRNLDRDSCLMLFYKYYLNSVEDLSHSRIMERKDMKYADNIIESVSHNTLLIELIGKMAYSENWKLDILWKKLENDVFGQDSRYAIETAHGDDGSLLKHIQKLYKMSKLSDKQKEIMSFIALFPAEHSIFFDVFEWAGFMDDSVDNLGELQKLGWIERDDKGYLIHTMVKGSIEQQYGKLPFDEYRYKNLIKELSHIRHYIPSDMDYTIKRERIIVPETISKLLSYNGSENPDTIVLYNSQANVYAELGYYDEALKYYQMALKINESVQGPEHPFTATMYNNMARVFEDQGDYTAALKYYKEALAINQKTKGMEHPDILSIYSHMATVYSEQGSFKEALNYCKKALVIQEKVLEAENPETAMTYSNIAAVYGEQGNNEEALKYFMKALVIQEKLLGAEHPETARTYSNLAAVYSEQGSFKEALNYCKKALVIQEKVLGAEHPETARTYSNIAAVHAEQGNNKEALDYFMKALAIQEKVLGAEHPETARTYSNIATVHTEQGNNKEALDYFMKALAIQEKLLGAEHPETARTYSNIANVYGEQSNYEEALDYLMKALAIQEKLLGEENPETARTYSNIATVHAEWGNNKEALDYFMKALAIQEKLLGEENPETARTYSNIATVHTEQGNNKEALDYFMKVLAIQKKLLGADHPETARTYSNIANVYGEQGNNEEALKYFEKALAIQEYMFGAENPRMKRTKEALEIIKTEQTNS